MIKLSFKNLNMQIRPSLLKEVFKDFFNYILNRNLRVPW